MNYEVKQVHGHYEIYINGDFYCSAENMTEVREEIEGIENNTKLML